MSTANEFLTVPMLDSHDNRIKPEHRAVFLFRGEFVLCAVDPRSTMEPWLGLTTPVFSVNRVAADREPETVTRDSLCTLTGLQLAELYESGRVRLGRATVELVQAWPERQADSA